MIGFGEDGYKLDGRYEYDDRRRDEYPRDRYDIDYSLEYDQRRGAERRYSDKQGYYNQCHNQNHRCGHYNRRNEHRDMGQEHRRGPDTTSKALAHPEQRRPEEINRMSLGMQLTSGYNGESSGAWKVYCYYCRQERRYNG